MAEDLALLTVRVDAGPEAGLEELDELTHLLRRELLELDVESVGPASTGQAPAGSRAGDALSVGTLAVTLLNSPELLLGVVGLVQSWLTRGSQRSVRLELDGDVLDVSGLTSRDQRELVRAWVARHRAPSRRVRRP
jgi:hypothetical protein